MNVPRQPSGFQSFAWGQRTFVMSVVNVTPDSFSGMGPGTDPEAAAAYACRDSEAGADILDIGGESTRPGAAPVSEAEDLARVLPVIQRLTGRVSVPLSVDTMKAGVARAALRAGAGIVNDIHGLRADPALAEVIAEAGAGAVLMANLRGERYSDVVQAAHQQLAHSLGIARRAGIPADRIVLDPGFGFGPTPEENLELVRRLGELRSLGQPLLIGVSRKSTIGLVLNLPVEERLEGTAALVALAIAGGADIVRVHDTRAMVRVARMADAVTRAPLRTPVPGDQAVR